MKKEIIEAFVEEMNDSFNDWVEFNGDGDEEQIEFIEEERVDCIQKIREAKDLDEVYEIFNSASSMLGHAITAKTAKINKKLKMLDLQMKKAQLDAKNAAKTEEIENTPLGAGQSLDRNELLKMFNTKNNEQ